MDRHVLEPAGFPDETQHGLRGVQAPLLTVHGGRVPEDVGTAPPGDDLEKRHRPVRPGLLPPPPPTRPSAGPRAGATGPPLGWRVAGDGGLTHGGK